VIKIPLTVNFYFIYMFFIPVINGEKATFNTPTFAKKRERTLDMLIKDLYSDYMSDSSKVVNFLYTYYNLYSYINATCSYVIQCFA
jgi:hypothetical protein